MALMVVTKLSSQTQKVTRMYGSNEQIIKHKAGLLDLAQELGNVRQACNPGTPATAASRRLRVVVMNRY